jgi:SAM-dependent methyltransferase
MISKIRKFVSNRDEYYPNVYIFSYHVLKGIHKLLIAAKILRPPKNKKDMFNWSLYHLHYKGELKVESKKLTQSLKKGDYNFSGGKLTKSEHLAKPLHSSHEVLYETILQLKPASVFEMGCGTGMHLNNIHVLLHKARVCGIDLLDKQLASLTRSYPAIAPHTKQADATVPFNPPPFPPCELAFTQAVIMHIHTDDLYLVALRNLFSMSTKYVIMMEGIRSRNYKADIQKLFDEGKIAWKQISFYYRINPETKMPNGIICSAIPLSYPELKDYSIFYEKK